MRNSFLLDAGLPPQTDRCAKCARALADPAKSDRDFVAALRIFDRAASVAVDHSTLRMFVGAKVLIARASPKLDWYLDHATARVGARVLVAIARSGRSLRILLFCARCGVKLAPLVAGRAGDAHYSWDWLVSFSRRPLWERLRERLPRGPYVRSGRSPILAADAQ